MFRSIIWAITGCIARFTVTRSRRPGVTVLHDAVLHHFFLGAENEREYVSPSSSTTMDTGARIWRASCGAAGRVRPPIPSTSAIRC